MSDIFGKIKSGAGKIAREADNAIDSKRIEMQIGSIKNQIDDLYRKLGQLTYDSSVKKELENPEVAGVIAKVTELKQLIASKEEEIKNIKEDKVVSQAPQASQAPVPTKKFCANCGKENEANSKFCVECGAKMG
ncbi:MAG: zinc ribbon 2 protein [Thermoproteota archaeon]|nr:zinc ribbon 2 protein [Thermoproteota archaeon]